MEIRQYTPDMQTPVTQFYNHLTPTFRIAIR